MIHTAEGVWIGNSADGLNLGPLNITALLNVAQDLHSYIGWPHVEHMQVGLIDGPGNPLVAYYSAVLALATLRKRHKRILVCCHTGSRSMAVLLMYLRALGERSWDALLTLLRERVDIDLPVPHIAHCQAFDKMNWKLLSQLVGDR